MKIYFIEEKDDLFDIKFYVLSVIKGLAVYLELASFDYEGLNDFTTFDGSGDFFL